MNIKMTKNIDEANCITHSGTFHSDEIFATIFLSKILPEITLCRTPIVEETKKNQYVYDIGGGELDHHQLGGNGERANGIKYASCGLVWKKYGKDVIKKYTDYKIDEIWEKIDKDLIQYIDAGDNGQIPAFNLDYRIVQLASIISDFNPNWDEEVDPDDRFFEALKIANIVFENEIKSTISKVKASEKVELAIENSKNGIMILDQFLPWKETLLDSKNKKAENIYFVVFPSNRGGYNIYTVPKQLGSFESRKLLPEEWAGLRDKELQRVTNVKTASFCHNKRFICVASTKEDALKLAKMASDK